MQEFGISGNRLQFLVQIELAINGSVSRGLQSRLKELHNAANHFVYLYPLQLWLRHPRKLAEASNDRFQVGNLSQQRRGALPKHFLKLFWAGLFCAKHFLDRELKGEQRIL